MAVKHRRTRKRNKESSNETWSKGKNEPKLYKPDQAVTSHIWFGSVLSKKAWIILCKTGPADLIWAAWPGFGQMDLIQKQASVQESSGLVLAECYGPATSFPLSDSGPFFHRWPRSHCTKLPWIWFGSGWLYQISAKQIRSRSNLVCKNHWA